VLQDPTRAMVTLEALQALGIELSIDDFGTGYSSLAYLKRLPISEVKVDRSFVSTMTTDPVDAVIVRSTIDLAHSLGLRTVAEGVEDGATLAELAALGCDLAQGYHLSRPLTAEALYHWAKRVAGRRWVLPTDELEPRVERPEGPAAVPEIPARDVAL
jgi:diguanylate cyclase